MTYVPMSERLSSEVLWKAAERYLLGAFAKDIATELGVTTSALIYHFRRMGIPKHTVTMLPSICQYCGKTFIYNKNHSQKGRQRLFCSVECRTAGFRGTFINRKARESYYAKYRMVPIPKGHVTRTKRSESNKMPEHVLIVELAVGRPLKNGEVVHHINGDKFDNRNANLLLCTRTYHNWIHARMGELYMAEHFPRVGTT